MEPRRPRALPVRLAVVGTVLIFVVCASWLVYRAVTIPVPEAVLIVRASPAWDGTIASVDGINLGKPREARFDRASKYSLSFHLLPGTYTLVVRRGDIELERYDFVLTRREPLRVRHLPDTPGAGTATTRPSWPFGIDFRWQNH
ncbi:MAG: hypothetical protein NZ561_05985 [Phycisphaerae bacterium]|nr:hypothetical protein [Phycisphaerae bacterium]MDW8262844.1 hypothetical protein [Phycisphaerales bacterium]